MKDKSDGKSRLYESFKSHWDAITKVPLQIEVPEIPDPKTGKPLVIYATPLNAFEANKVALLVRDDDLKAWVKVIIIKAEDADGNKLFTEMDEKWLMTRVPPTLLQRIGVRIFAHRGPSETELGN